MTGIYPVVLCGGSGSRLWPLSRSAFPKQFLPLAGDATMLQDTIDRLAGVAGIADRCLVVCNEAHRFLVAEQVASAGIHSRILLEPEGRNTAPAIALAALFLQASVAPDDAQPLMLVSPADHVIRDPGAFSAAVALGRPHAEDGKLVVFGITPTTPHTGYGYIEAEPGGDAPANVLAFVEKPGLDRAREFLASGRHYWNSGIFMFRSDRIIEEIESFAPGVVAACSNALAARAEDPDFVRPGEREFLECPPGSIDRVVMEKTDRAVVVPLDAGWNDLGSWRALHDIGNKDEAGNVTSGDALLVDSQRTLVRSESRLVTAVGVQDLAIVETSDAVLVADLARAQSVRELVDALGQEDRGEREHHRQVFRPWGSYDSLELGDGFQVKRLVINPGAVLSLQYHHRRAEHWIVVRGKARITLDGDESDLAVNESAYIPKGATHRIANPFDEPLHIIEVQCGDYLGEDDIVRLADNYGREGTST